MGTNNFSDKEEGDIIIHDDPNQYNEGLSGNLVPRAAGAVVADAGDLGTPSFPWRKANISAGYWVCGDIKMFDSYNGLLTPGQGWWPMNGSAINQAGYDEIHGEGSWAKYIGTSPLEGKWVKDARDRFPVGSESTEQDGSTEQTYEGNSDHQVDLAHTHVAPSHNHVWYVSRPTGEDDTTYDANGSATNLSDVSNKTSNARAIEAPENANDPVRSDAALTLHTSNGGGSNTGSGGSATQNIKPDSFSVEYWIRII